jgi:hypothetical protein
MFQEEKEIANPEKTIETTLCVYESALVSRAIEDGVLNENTFIADTGASSHMEYSKKYLTDLIPYDASITAGHEDLMKCTNKGTYRGYFKNAVGKKIPLYLTDVLHFPGLNVNLFLSQSVLTNQKYNFKGHIRT